MMVAFATLGSHGGLHVEQVAAERAVTAAMAVASTSMARRLEMWRGAHAAARNLAPAARFAVVADFDGGAITRDQSFTMLAGSRLGAAFADVSTRSHCRPGYHVNSPRKWDSLATSFAAAALHTS